MAVRGSHWRWEQLIFIYRIDGDLRVLKDVTCTKDSHANNDLMRELSRHTSDSTVALHAPTRKSQVPQFLDRAFEVSPALTLRKCTVPTFRWHWV